MLKSQVVGLSWMSLWRENSYYTIFAHSIGISKKHITSGLNVYDLLPFHTCLAPFVGKTLRSFVGRVVGNVEEVWLLDQLWVYNYLLVIVLELQLYD